MNRMVLSLATVAVVFFSLASVQGQQPLQATIDANSVWVRAGDSPILQYRYGDVPFKPYVKELYTPSGLNILLDAPPDHLHHHGLMFAVAVDGLNFWEETGAAGHQQSSDWEMDYLGKQGPDFAGFRTISTWVDAPGGKEALKEERYINVYRHPKLKATVLIWESVLSVPQSKKSVTLSGAHYFGLGMRFVHAMDGGEFFNADDKEGTIFRGEERLVQSKWCAYTAAVDGKPVTVAMFAYPGNLRHPTTWFMMAKPFAYLSATLNLHEEPLALDAGRDSLLQYAVVAWDGRVDKGRIDEAYQWFLGGSSGASKSMKGAEHDGKQK